MSAHAQLHARHRAVMPSWLALYYDEPIALERGEGRHVWDAEGRRYLDWFGGILTTSTAYALPEVVDAVQQQAERMLHSSTLYLIESQVELAELIAEQSGIPDAKVFFCASGTEATETALLLTTNFRRSNQVLALRNSYHGRSFGAMAITGNRSWRASTLAPVNVSYVPNGYRYRSAGAELSDAEYVEQSAQELRRILDTTTTGDVACMIAEPIQGVGGFATPPDGFFAAYKAVLDEYDVPFVSDEVQTGWGRCGDHFWGIGAHGVTPDAMTFAKGLGNGLAIGGIVARAELMDSVNAGSISTFGGNPLSTAGSLANLRYILANDLQRNARDRGEQVFVALRELLAQGALPSVGDLRGKGLMIGAELVVPGSSEPDGAAAGAVMEECKANGLLIGKGGLYGNCLRIAPPMTITADEIEEGLATLTRAIATVQQRLHGIEPHAAIATEGATPS